MPGYGYAAVGKEIAGGLGRRWCATILRGRTTLMRAFVLVDGRHGVKAS